MISEKYRCIFIHVPKTAGQSVEQFFLELAGLSWDNRAPLLLRYNPDPNRGPQSLAHLTAAEYVDCKYLTPGEFNSYFRFSFVRNPWDRLVSEYRYRNYAEKYSFKQFVLEGLPAKDPYSDAYRHVMPQSDFIFDKNGQPLVDFIGRFETLQSDFDFVCQRLGIVNSKLPFKNQSTTRTSLRDRIKGLFSDIQNPPRIHYSSYYDDDSKELVAVQYASDIEAFGYQFEYRVSSKP